MAILSKACKLDNFELHNYLKLRYFSSVDFKSFFYINSPDILGLCETNLDDRIDSDPSL